MVHLAMFKSASKRSFSNGRRRGTFTILEDMRRALLHLLVEEMGSSFARSQKSVRSQREHVPTLTSSEEETEKLVGEVLRRGAVA